MALEVADACSGIRSLMSLATLAVIYGYLMERSTALRVLLALASIPIAVAANSLRVVGTGLLVQYWDRTRRRGFFMNSRVGSCLSHRWPCFIFCIAAYA